MENLELLTDDQLRSRLQQYGFANLPVTETTRKVLEKKLRLAYDGQKTKNRRETVAVSKFSSDEESAGAKRDKTPNRRTTSAMGAMKSAVTPSKNGITNGNLKLEAANKSSRRSHRPTPVKEKPSTAYIGTDSDEDIIEVPVTRNRSRTPSLGKSETVRTSYKTTVEVMKEDTEEEIIRLDDDQDLIPAPRKPSPILTQTIRRKGFTTSSAASPSMQEIKTSNYGRATLSTSYNPRGNYNFVEEQDDKPLELNDSNTPYLSSFAKRLSTLRAEPLDDGLDKYKSLKDSTPSASAYQPLYQQQNYSHAYSTIAPASGVRKQGILKDLSQIFDSLDRQYNFRTILYVIFIVMIVVAIYVIFM